MATVKKNNKKKVIVSVCIVLVIAIIAGTAFGFTKANSGEQVELYTIASGDINESVSLTGEVTAGTSKEYKVAGVATVKEVFVKVGDEVKQNDVLATFDVTSLDNQINSLQASYNESLQAYNSAVATQKESKAKADALQKEITALESKVAKLQSSANTTTTKPAATHTAKQTGGATYSANVLSNTTNPTLPNNNASDTEQPGNDSDLPSIGDDYKSLGEQLEDLNNTLSNLTMTMDQLLETTNIIAENLAQITSAVGSIDEDELAQNIVDALVESGLAETVAHEIVAAIDFEGIANTLVNSNSTQLTAAQIQLLTLEGQHAIYNAQADPKIVNTQKKVMETSKEALDLMKDQKQELSEGWKAAFDGTVTAVEVYDGMQTTALTTGITVENLDSMAVTVSLSEYDYHKVRVGMPAVITTAYGTYDGEVMTIAPTATGGSSSSMLDSVGSMAGISGLSSLTDTGAGVECTISVPKADENIIVGFEANVEIETGQYADIPVVPIESIVLEKTGSYVYLYNEEDSTVTKTLIETGAISDTSYEIKSGLKPGDKIIAAPGTNYEEDTFKVKVKNQ